MKQIKGGVTAAKGYEAASTAAGIKYQGRTDMALIYSQVPCVSAGTFTTNVVKAAPVKWDRQIVDSGAGVQAVVVNSGIANACTGEEGMGYCKETAEAAAKALNIDAAGVLVGSTGVIGMQLPMQKLVDGIQVLAGKKAEGLQSGHDAALAIMTTDTVEKEMAVEIEIGGKTVTIGGMSKGSGMIHPNMCTMLAFITTDAAITKEALQKALSEDVEDTYNMISVDGMQKLVDGIQVLAGKKAEGLQSGHDAALAIMTTDTVEKEMAVEIEIGGKTVTIGGMSKGSGMIHPNMCTMLAFITTDAAITKEALQKALSEDVEDTYNMISVDGDTSTNDTAILLANGLAGNQEITYASSEYETFKEALHMVNETLAKKMAGDGEGATALFEVKVVGAESIKQAKTLAKSVVCSNLTKAAIAGHDANWGRILCAMGYSGVQFDPEKVDLFFESKAGKLQIIENGVATDYSEEVATKILSEPEITATADIKMGDYSATAWGCDLTHEYININADYRS